MTPGRPAPLAALLVAVLLVVGLVAAGLVVGLCSLLSYRHAWYVAGTTVPWGLALCLATEYAGARAAGLLAAAPGAVGFGAGWLALLLATFSGRPEGDYLIAADARGYAYMIGGIALVGLAIGQAVSAPPRKPGGGPPRL